MKRSGKFYRRNEKEIMQQLGLNPTPNSGSGWIVKEDGENDNCICQLKSTDAQSIKVSLDDIHTLDYHALVSHKIPIFVIQFLKTNEVFLLIKPQELQEIAGCILSDSHINNKENISASTCDLLEASNDKHEVKVIKSSDTARQELRDEITNRFKKKVRSAK